MALSGGLAGLAGMSEVAGIAHLLQRNLSPGYGYTAIIVAWLAKLNPGAIVVVSFLFAGLLVGGDQLQISMGLPAAIAPMLQGTILFFLLGGDILARYRFAWTRRPAPAVAAEAQPERRPGRVEMSTARRDQPRTLETPVGRVQICRPKRLIWKASSASGRGLEAGYRRAASTSGPQS